MSAFAAQAALAMTCRSARSTMPSITARPSAAEKARFTWLAERAGMSESALALVAIRGLLDPDGEATKEPVAAGHVAATDRITIRLRPGDGSEIARRAATRGMKASAYLAALARAHVRKNPPIPDWEVRKIKEGVTVLARLGHVLLRVAQSPALREGEFESLRRDLAATRAVVAALEGLMHDHARAALVAWETRHE